MQAQYGYSMHLLETYWTDGKEMPGGQTLYLRIARKAQYKKELTRP